MERSVSTSLQKIWIVRFIYILKEKLPEMKRVVHKNFILVRDNEHAHGHISETTQNFIKEKKINELKDLTF